jgi:hypothetical protein
MLAVVRGAVGPRAGKWLGRGFESIGSHDRVNGFVRSVPSGE